MSAATNGGEKGSTWSYSFHLTSDHPRRQSVFSPSAGPPLGRLVIDVLPSETTEPVRELPLIDERLCRVILERSDLSEASLYGTLVVVEGRRLSGDVSSCHLAPCGITAFKQSFNTPIPHVGTLTEEPCASRESERTGVVE